MAKKKGRRVEPAKYAPGKEAEVQSIAMPAAFLNIRIHDLKTTPSLSGLCVGYEKEAWRTPQLVDHMMEWMPEFALKYSELDGITAATSVPLLRQAAKTVYKSEKFKNRGEFGELLLHIAVRQVFRSLPAISKLYYKSARNDTVKGFDAVHVVGPVEDLELWLGEAKLYDNIARAIRDVAEELKKHTDSDYLRDEFMLIKGKIDPKLPHAAALKVLLDHNRSLDAVFKRVAIPVLLTYDSDCVAAHKECGAAYEKMFAEEIEKNYKTFAASALPKEVRIHLFLLPLKSKKELIAALDAKLKTWQNLPSAGSGSAARPTSASTISSCASWTRRPRPRPPPASGRLRGRSPRRP